MLQNAYLLAKIGADIAENERILPKIAKIGMRVTLVPLWALFGDGGLSGDAGPQRYFCNFFEYFAIFWQARSRLYRNQILQVNTRWKALAEIYTMHSFALL